VIQIKPTIEYQSLCPYCSEPLQPLSLLWQGIHVCSESKCVGCEANIVVDLPTGHALYWPYQADVQKKALFGDDAARSWFGDPLLASLLKPLEDPVRLEVEKFAEVKKALILNCLDSWYGHALLKLLNAESDALNNPQASVVVIIPKALRWLVPKGVAEIWTVDLPLAKTNYFYKDLNRKIQHECERFDRIFLSTVFPHPRDFDISRFTRVPRHDFSRGTFRVTFVWREDRLWITSYGMKGRRSSPLGDLLLRWQNAKVRLLFRQIRKQVPHAVFTVAGLGTSTQFPSWIHDCRLSDFSDQTEREICEIYSESRLVIGIHGSNMLLPSAHAGHAIDLIPQGHWGNFAQDVIYQESDPRLAAFRYRYLPANMGLRSLSDIAVGMIGDYPYYQRQMMNEVH
jgi:hypothetical protein